MTRDEYKKQLKEGRRELRKARRKGAVFFDRHPNLSALCMSTPYQRRQADRRCIDFYLQDKGLPVLPVLEPGDTITVSIYLHVDD